MVKPKGKVFHSSSPKPGLLQVLEVESLETAVWCPDDQAQQPPEQVHLILKVKGLDYPFIVRFLGPDTLGFFLEEMSRYRRQVWPDAEPLQVTK
jgi:hypothetical protein